MREFRFYSLRSVFFYSEIYTIAFLHQSKVIDSKISLQVLIGFCHLIAKEI